MGKTVVKLDALASRPIVHVLVNGQGFRAIVDTGATAPVWVISEKILQTLGAKVESVNARIGGFGGEEGGKKIYLIDIKIGKARFLQTPVIAARLNNTNFQLVLPATLFRNMVYTINPIRHTLTLEIAGDQWEKQVNYRYKNGVLALLMEGEEEALPS